MEGKEVGYPDMALHLNAKSILLAVRGNLLNKKGNLKLELLFAGSSRMEEKDPLGHCI